MSKTLLKSLFRDMFSLSRDWIIFLLCLLGQVGLPVGADTRLAGGGRLGAAPEEHSRNGPRNLHRYAYSTIFANEKSQQEAACFGSVRLPHLLDLEFKWFKVVCLGRLRMYVGYRKVFIVCAVSQPEATLCGARVVTALAGLAK